MVLRWPCGARVAAVTALVAALAAAARGAVDDTILYDDCLTPADEPNTKKGTYFNLCIQGHAFEDERHAYVFTKSEIRDSTFDNVAFANTPEKGMNLTEAKWMDVRFSKTTFGSFTKDPVIFDHTLFANVEFVGCTFETTANLIFSNFEFRNVTFVDCEFQSDTLFKLGQMTEVFFNSSSFKRSKEAKTVSGDDHITFDQVTMRNVYFTDNDFITPVTFEAAAVADMHVNNTQFGALTCHDTPSSGDKEPKKFAAFNDTVLDNVRFRDSVACDRVTWRSMHMYDVRFDREADFSKNDVLDIYWDNVIAKSPEKDCHTLDLSDSIIRRGVLKDVEADCKADFSDASLTQVNIRNFNADQPDFQGAQFNEQEYVDGQCCTNACVNLECKCNVTEPSGACPEGSSSVNVNKDGACFPGHASVALNSGAIVRLADLEHGSRIAAGAGAHSDVYMFGHRDPDAVTEYVRIDSAASAMPLLISRGHYLYVNGRLATAETVAPGDSLRGSAGADDVVVYEVSHEVHAGAYAPTTVTGELLVDGVVVSSYTDVMHPEIAHRLLQPVRALYGSPLRGVVPRVTSVMHTRSWDWLLARFAVEEGPGQL